MLELNTPPDPCIGVCTLDNKRICLGCRRTQDEICEWRNASNDRRKEILKECKARIMQHSSARKPIRGL